jgi:hypothetical protein
MSSIATDDNANGNGPANGVAQHLNWSKIPVEQMAEGIERQMLVGDRMMICRFRFKPFLVTPGHDHPHEQMTIVERGRTPTVLRTREITPKAFTNFSPGLLQPSVYTVPIIGNSERVGRRASRTLSAL